LLRIAITAIALISFLLPLQGLQIRSTEKKPPLNKPAAKRPIDLENLINDARSLPAEFAIDVFLRVAAANSVDKKWKQEMLAEAFLLTAGVQNEMRLKSKPQTPVDTRINYRSYAFDLNLDALSLRSKIISQMALIDKDQALRMLSQIPTRLRFPALSCADQMVYNVDDFYKMIGMVTRTVHDERKIQQGERVQFLLPYIEGLTSPAQIVPLIRMITALRLTQKELLMVSQAFASALKQISADDRSFTAALLQDRTARSVFEFIQQLKKEGGAHNEVTSAIQGYFSRHLNGVRCEDNVTPTGTELPSHIREINYYYPISPLTLDDLRPSKVEEGLAIAEYFESKDSSKLFGDFKELRGYDDDDPSTKESKTSSAWQERMLIYLRQLENWEGRDEGSAIDYFHQKSVLYFALARIVPAGESRQRVMTSYISFISDANVLKESRIEWLLHERELLGLLQEKGDEPSRLLDSLAYSKNPVLQAHARLIKANLN
jgi:hypothetical protein